MIGVKGCFNCPFRSIAHAEYMTCHARPYGGPKGWHHGINGRPSDLNAAERDAVRAEAPTTPNWCPLREGPVTVALT